MPLEVGEIGISLTVGDRPASTAGARNAKANDSCGSDQASEQRDDMVEECVRRVLAILRAQQER